MASSRFKWVLLSDHKDDLGVHYYVYNWKYSIISSWVVQISPLLCKFPIELRFDTKREAEALRKEIEAEFKGQFKYKSVLRKF